MKPDQGIENEKSGTVKHERGFEPLLIGRVVQTQRIRRDDTNIQVRQLESVVLGEGFQAPSQGRFGVFSGIEKHRAR